MIRIDDAKEFLSLVLRSGLLSQADVDSLAKAFPDEYVAAQARGTAIAVAAFLTARGVLTSWQCQKLREGKYKGFFLDQYKFLAHLGYDDQNNYYLAQDVASRKQFQLKIHPFKDRWSGRITYDIEASFD